MHFWMALPLEALYKCPNTIQCNINLRCLSTSSQMSVFKLLSIKCNYLQPCTECKDKCHSNFQQICESETHLFRINCLKTNQSLNGMHALVTKSLKIFVNVNWSLVFCLLQQEVNRQERSSASNSSTATPKQHVISQETEHIMLSLEQE